MGALSFCPGNASGTGIFPLLEYLLSWEKGETRDISWLRNGFVPEMWRKPGCSLCAGGDHSLESVSQCLEEELPAELVGNMVGLNTGGDAFREEVVGETAHVEGVGL